MIKKESVLGFEAVKTKNPNVLKERRTGQWSLTLWKPKVEGKKARIQLKYGYKQPGKDWVDQSIYCFENNLQALCDVLMSWDKENED